MTSSYYNILHVQDSVQLWLPDYGVFSINTESEKTYDELKGFLGFRHFIRHAYSFEINPLTINSILDNTHSLVELFIREVTDYYRNKFNPG